MQAPSAADVEVLIVAFRSKGTFPRLSAALDAQTVRPAAIHVLENGSPDPERIDLPDLPAGADLIVSETNLGFAAGNNLLAARARSKWLALLNPDAFPEPDWLERLLNAATRYPDAGLFGSTQWVDGENVVLDGCGDVWQAFGIPYRGGYGLSIQPPPEGEVFGPCGAAMMIRRDVFEALGGFDEDYFCYVEDVDLAYRARLSGHRAIQVRSANVVHVGYASSGGRSDFATYHGVRNRLMTFIKNTPLPWLVVLVPFHIAMTLTLWGFAARSTQSRLFRQAIGDALKAWPRLMVKRRAVQKSRTVSPWALARAWAWNPVRLRTRAPHIWIPRRDRPDSATEDA